MEADFTLKIADKDDIQGIQDLLYPEYFEETAYAGMEYDPEATREYITRYIDENINFVALVDEKIVAFATLSVMRTFYKDIEADVEMFVISKPCRGTGVSRALVDCIVQNADANNAKIIYTSCLSGIGEKNDTLYQNLFKKFGFKTLGTVMTRSKP